MTDAPQPTPNAPAPTESGAHEEATSSGNAEAAKYRRQLRDTEAERDQLTERLRTAHTQRVEALAADRLADPTDLWRYGTELADLTTEDGDLDNDKVTAALDALAEQRPYLAKPQPNTTTHMGARKAVEHTASWEDVLKR